MRSLLLAVESRIRRQKSRCSFSIEHAEIPRYLTESYHQKEQSAVAGSHHNEAPN